MKTVTSSTARFTFKKEERLSGKKSIDELFTNGSSFYLKPFKIIFLEHGIPNTVDADGWPGPPVEKITQQIYPARILISVPKKNFKKAVDRNKIKRMIREAYRQHKHELYGSLKSEKKQMTLAVLYTSKKMEPFDFILQKIVAVVARLSSKHDVAEKNRS